MLDRGKLKSGLCGLVCLEGGAVILGFPGDPGALGIQDPEGDEGIDSLPGFHGAAVVTLFDQD